MAFGSGYEEMNVDIDNKGNIHVDVVGGEGKSCDETIAFLQKAMKGKVLKETCKPEYYKRKYKTKIKRRND